MLRVTSLALTAQGEDKDRINLHDVSIQSDIGTRVATDHQFPFIAINRSPIMGLYSSTAMA